MDLRRGTLFQEAEDSCVAALYDRWSVVVEDGGSAVAKVEWSRDGERWHELAPADGILDGLRETFSLEAADGRHLLVVRAIDLHHNRATIGATER